MTKNINNIWKIVILFFGIIISSCQPDDNIDGNPLTASNLDATFTIIPNTTSPNKFTLRANNTSYIKSAWNLDDGAGMSAGPMVKEIFLPDAGTYNIKHYAIGAGGVIVESSQVLNVTASDPNSGNLVLGGKFETASDISKWTILQISASGAQWTFANGKAKINASGWQQQGIYQEINLVAGRTYKVDLIASSTTGVSNTWFEVFLSNTAPVQNNDYSTGKVRQINTWAGCGSSPFSGWISSVGCGGDNAPGTFTPSVSGTAYLVIKSGGEDLQDGISIDNVEVRGI